MAVTAAMYGLAFLSAFNAEIDWLADSIKMMLTTSAYTPNQDTHDYKDDVTNEVTGTNYTATGLALSSKTITYTAGTNVIKMDAADPLWGTATITARRAVIYDATPASDATRPLMGYIDFGQDEVSTTADFTVVFDASGIFTITVAVP